MTAARHESGDLVLQAQNASCKMRIPSKLLEEILDRHSLTLTARRTHDEPLGAGHTGNLSGQRTQVD